MQVIPVCNYVLGLAMETNEEGMRISGEAVTMGVERGLKRHAKPDALRAH